MRSNKKGVKSKLSYKFDDLMSKGFRSKVLMLLMLTIFIVISAALLACFWAGDDDQGFIKNIWVSLMHAIDAGTITADDGTIGYMVIMTFVTICGLLITSVLIGIINNGLEMKMDELRKGKSTVLEKNHTIILGFPKEIYGMLKELDEGNPNRKKNVVVIMTDLYEKTEMEDMIERYAPDLEHLHVICRHGNISKKEDILICSPQTCKSIIIRARNDFLTIKSILAVTSILGNTKNNKAFISTVIREEANYDAAKDAAIDKNGINRAEVLLYDDVVSRIIAHTSRHAGLSKVFTELFNFAGDEIYFKKCTIPSKRLFKKQEASLIGLDIGSANLHFKNATVLGICKSNTINRSTSTSNVQLNPFSKTIIRENDELILLAADEKHLTAEHLYLPESSQENENNDIKRINVRHNSSFKKKTGNLLILGYSHRLEKILMVQDKYFGPDTRITLAVAKDNEDEDFDKNLNNLKKEYSNIDLNIITDDIYDRDNTLRILAEKQPETVVILSNSFQDAENEDSKTLVLLLNLREYAKTHPINIICEMQRSENEELASLATNINDFIVGGKLISLMLTQISQDRRRRFIFRQLLNEKGAEIYIRSATDYVRPKTRIDIHTIANEIYKHSGEIFIGYRYTICDNKMEIKLNMSKDRNHELYINDDARFIVLSTAPLDQTHSDSVTTDELLDERFMNQLRPDDTETMSLQR